MAGVLRSAVLALTLSSACASYAQSSGDFADVGDLRLEGLPKQELREGHCSLFLWSKSERPVFILVADDNPARATVQVKGKLKKVDRTNVSGQKVFGQFEKQSFRSGDIAFDLDLAFDQDRPVKDGAVIKSGVLRARMKDGAEALLPVGGMVGCKAA